MLCGSMFGLGATCDDGVWRYLQRHRLFETSWGPGRAPTCRHPEGRPIGVYGAGGGWKHGSYMANARESAECMGIDWMTTRELSQAIPPAYTEFLGKIMLERMS